MDRSMRNPAVRALHLAVLLAVLAVSSACERAGTGARVEVGRPAPEYRAPASLDGGETSLAALRGKPVLLNIWATWCHPCREEMPALQRLHEEYGPRGLQVVGVSIDRKGEEDAIREFLAGFGTSYPIWLDPAERISSTFQTVGVPTTYLIAADGTVLWQHLGPVRANDAGLNTKIRDALEQAS